MKLVDGVETVGELEVLDFLDKKVSSEPNKYLLIDSRTNGWYEQNTIPGAVNVPYTDLEYDEDFIEDYNQALRYLGIKIKKDGTYDFTDVKEVIMFCNGSWCAQSPNAIKHLVKIGFPPKKIKWYRGGMTSWLSVGLSTMPGKEE
jgi:rhodanese-related sulfurtransferase